MNQTQTPYRRGRRSHCVGCGRKITEKVITKAADYNLYIGAYGCEDTEMAWQDDEKRAMCDASHDSTYHISYGEWRDTQNAVTSGYR